MRAISPEALDKADAVWQSELKGDPSLANMLCGVPFDNFLRVGGDNTNHINHLNTADSDSRTEAEIAARRGQVSLMRALGAGGVTVLGSAPESAARESRRILGDVYMTGEDYLQKRVYDDAVCYTYWFIDIHQADQPAHIVYLRDEKTPTISLGAMRPRGLQNVYVAGRCVSSDRSNNSAIRVKASCMAMGQAAGAAAVEAARCGGDTRSADLGAIRALLAQSGAIVPPLDA